MRGRGGRGVRGLGWSFRLGCAVFWRKSGTFLLLYHCNGVLAGVYLLDETLRLQLLTFKRSSAADVCVRLGKIGFRVLELGVWEIYWELLSLEM